MNIPPEACHKIRAEMSRCGYTTESLSQKTEISVTVLRKLLSGRADTISTRNLYALAHAFGYETSVFLDLLTGSISYPAPHLEDGE